ncbi:MAG: DNA-directed RNA polymerase subunit omega [Bdellovibrio sp.]|nr:DNA-directed RNA polymerase subunit omega [Bdellovibrio sp.]
MARVTIEDCLKNVENMYELVHLATKRARQLYKGADPLVKSKNRIIVTALREVAAGRVKAATPDSFLGLDEDLPPMSN